MAESTMPGLRQVASRQDLAQFVSALHEDLTTQGTVWENMTLERFLDALARWLESADHWAANMHRFAPERAMDVETPSWKVMAAALRAACVYE